MHGESRADLRSRTLPLDQPRVIPLDQPRVIPLDQLRANPVTSTYTSYRLIARDIPSSIERIASEPQIKRESEYYLSRISEIKSVDDFMADSRIYNYAMKAHGLEEMSYAKAFIRKVLTEGVDDEGAFANQLADSRYKDFAETFNFARHGSTATIFTKAQQGTVDKYHRLTLEEEAGVDNTGVRLALYFERTAPEISSVYTILADTALADVVRTALGIPAELAASDIDKQADLIKSRLDIEDFKDPEKLSKFLDRFTALWELDNPSAGTIDSSMLFSSSAGFGITPDLMLQLNNLKLGGR